MKNIAFIFLLLIPVFTGCKKETEDPNAGNEDSTSVNLDDDLNEADNAFLASASAPNPTLREMFGSNDNVLGRMAGISGASSAVGDLTDNMLRDAQSLCGQKTHLYPQVGDDITKPAHMGLVYSKGQRDITQRMPPPYKKANELHKKYSVYGTDCSGFIINILRHSGLNIDDTDVSNFEKTLSNALKNNSQYRDVAVVNLGPLPIKNIKSGDFVVWLRKEGNHMGVLCKVSTGDKVVFQSNGTGTPVSEADQKANLGGGRGVHPLSFSKVIVPANRYWDKKYQILRMRDTISYNLTNDSIKYWKVNPKGVTTYCGQSTANPVVAMDDIYIFNSNGSFSHKGGAVTTDPNLKNCGDGGNYSNTWIFNKTKTSIILGGGIELKILSISKSRIIIMSSDSKFDLIPNY